MKLTKIVIVATALALAGSVAQAQTQNSDTKFPNNQLTIDAFGSYHQAFDTFGSQFDDSWRHGVWGGGIGLNFYFNKYIGVGVDSYGEDKGPILKDTTGNLYLRLPVGETGFAPYIFGGVGGDYHPVASLTEDCGVGLQFKFNSHWGIFVDDRYIYADKLRNTSLARAGFTYGF